MSIINNGLLLASGADAATTYQISRSLRFNGTADSTYLNRTFSTGNRKTWTWSGWVKRSTLSSGFQTLFSGGSGGGRLLFGFGSGDTFSFELQGTGAHATTAVFRDPSAWYHVVVAFDTTQATAADRTKVWINSTLQTLSGLTFSQNTDYAINSNVEHRIGCQTSSVADFFNGYLADIYFLDGTATDPSTFAETDAVTGQWVPKTPTGISYGTNGFRLTFSDNSGTTSTTLGNDVAGSNDWTPNNFSVASGSGNDSLVDSPTSYGTDAQNGGEVRGNYCTWNPLDKGSPTASNGNLDVSGTSSHQMIRGTVGISSGKWYWEVLVNTFVTDMIIGISKLDVPVTQYVGKSANSWGYWSNTSTGYKINNDSFSSYGARYTNGDIIGVAFDADNGTLTFYKNGSSQGQAYSGLTSGPYLPAISQYASSGSDSTSTNFGARAFSYQAPSGFKALCDTNLTAPTIALPASCFDAKLYTGSGGSQSITGLGFNPDLVWIKARSSAYKNELYDAVRGVQKSLNSDTTGAEETHTNALSSFDSTGFSFSGGRQDINQSSTTFVAWCWDAGSSTATNTQGSITSQVRANASAGFSIVTYTGAGSAGTVGHGLGVAPSLVIVKQRSYVAGGTNWQVYQKDIGNTKSINLNTTGTPNTDIGWWNNTSPTSTTFSVGTYMAGSSYDFVAYCFAPVAGYSSFGSYTGNGSSDGSFIHLGFRPRFFMHKRTDSSAGFADWRIWDSARDTYNASGSLLFPNTSNAEAVSGEHYVDFLSNGVKIRNSNANVNPSGATFIYCAWAESPFQYARAR